MVWMIYAMFAIVLLVLIVFVVTIVRRSSARARTNTNAGAYDVFEVSGNQLTVLTGIPVTYEIKEIREITFSVKMLPSNRYKFNGMMRVINTNGKKSRPFWFDSSVYAKRMVLSSSKQDIEQTVQYLMNKLRQYHIRCRRAS